MRERLDDPSARGLASAVSRAVREGALRAGDRLPPIRTVATELGLSPTTVSAAWSLLARAGTIRTDGRRGTTIADRQRTGSPRYQRALDRTSAFRLDLSTGVPDPALLPDLARAVASLRSAATPSSYLDAPVVPELAEVLRADWPYPPDELTVVDGAMDGLELVTRVLVEVGDRVAVEHPVLPAAARPARGSRRDRGRRPGRRRRDVGRCAAGGRTGERGLPATSGAEPDGRVADAPSAPRNWRGSADVRTPSSSRTTRPARSPRPIRSASGRGRPNAPCTCAASPSRTARTCGSRRCRRRPSSPHAS